MAGNDVLEVVEPGLLTTVQDGGRPGLTAEGVTPGGAADSWSLSVANALVGNPHDAAALELTLVGPTLRALRSVTVALAGTIGGRVIETGVTVRPGTAVPIAAGMTLCLDGPATGARGYLAIPGGVDVPVVLGSRSTALGAGFGGLDGRPLRAGDRIRAGAGGQGLLTPATTWPGAPAPEPGDIRILPGPHAADLGPAALEALAASDWIVTTASDRVGLRLDGPALPGEPAGELASHGVVEGTIQVPPDRHPIVLLADHQPTGGYPVVAVVIRGDLPRLAQLAPGMSFRLVGTTRNQAREEQAARRREYGAALTAMHQDVRWDDLWRSAGG